MSVHQFYACIAALDVSTQTWSWADRTMRQYGFALCKWPTSRWGSSGNYVRNLLPVVLAEADTNNVLYHAEYLRANALVPLWYGDATLRFCLTPDTTSWLDNYISVTVYESGYNTTPMNFRVDGVNYENIFQANYSYDGNRSKAPYWALSSIITDQTTASTCSLYSQGTDMNHYTIYCVQNPLSRNLADGFLALINKAPTPSSVDPYEGGGISVIGGGTGNFDTSSESVNIPSLPSTTAVSTGFLTLFNPSTAKLRDLASYMWSNPLFDLSAWRKIFADPMGAILGLSIVPVAVPTSGNAEVTVGNIPTGIEMPLVSNQYVEVDCGSIQVKEFWGGYLDYSPYTKAEIYLPYCGIHAIDIDDIMEKTVNVVYHIDILSGACCVYVKCDTAILYTFIGQCSSSIPITGDSWTNVINGVLSAAVSVGSMVATGGATAPMALPQLASTVTNSLKPSIEKSGAMGGTGGLLAYQYPYLIITRPRQALSENQNKYMGYPSFVTAELGSLRGYTEVEQVHLENINATDSELKEIETLLKNGVIF